MRIALISVSNKQPAWVREGFDHYARRLGRSCRLELVEIPLAKRAASVTVERLLEREGERMLAAIPKDAHVVALDERGHAWSTSTLAERVGAWSGRGVSVALLVGGPDGLAPECSRRAAEAWSLSALTLPHGLVRIVVAEALYRAFSLRQGHPYHRGAEPRGG